MKLIRTFVEELTDEGHTVEEVGKPGPTDKHGYVVVADTVTIEGKRFDGRLMLNVYDDRVEGRGVDIHSRADHQFSDERRELLDSVSTCRHVMGEDWLVWNYRSQTGVNDDLDEHFEQYRSVFRRIY